MKKGTRVRVTGPKGSAQSGKKGAVVSTSTAYETYPDLPKTGRRAVSDYKVVTVLLDGEDRPRLFHADDLKEGKE